MSLDSIDHTKVSDTSRQFVCFIMGKDVYGVNIFNTQEIIRVPEITPIPNSKIFVEGIVNLRGEVIPVINLEVKFQIQSTTRQSKEIIVLRSNNSKIGLLVNKVFRVLNIDITEISKPPAILSGIDEEFILGVSRLEDSRMIIFLDVEKMLFMDMNDERSNH